MDHLGDDLLKGIEAIAEFLRVPKRRAYYLCENAYIPCGKEGATWVASKHALREHYRKLTGGAEPTPQKAAA
jgi:hypothetical protein